MRRLDSPPGPPPASPRVGSAPARVLKNSAWLVAQPLALNLLSLVAVAYIARTLGRADYGKYIYALSFASMFMPLTNLGLRLIGVREMATADPAALGAYFGRLAVLRAALGVVATAAAIVVAVAGQNPPETRAALCVASGLILLSAVQTTYVDLFQAHERMRAIAQIQFVAGLALTLLSVLALYLGYGLLGLVASYLVGNALNVLLCAASARRDFPRPIFALDLAFWRQSLWRGAPVFLPILVVAVGGKLGIVILAEAVGDVAVGSFGAAGALVDKLVVIPDGVCTALFPALVVVYARSREEAADLYRKLFRWFLAFALPIAVGTTLLAGRIVQLVYGQGYERAAPVLIVLVWGLFVTFFIYLQGWSLGAIHQEKRAAAVPVIATFCSLGCTALLVSPLHELGLAIAGVVQVCVIFVLYDRIVRAHLAASTVDAASFARVLAAVAVMGAVTWGVRDLHVLASISIGAVTYAVAALAFGVVSRDEVREASGAVRRRFAVARAPGRDAATPGA